MKLYELEPKSNFRIVDYGSEEIFFFDHIDGMYSVCIDDKGQVYHLYAWMEVIPIEDVCV